MRRWCPAWLGVVGFVACTNEPVSSLPIQAHLASADAWSGDTIRVISSALNRLSVLPRLILGVDTFLLSRLDDTTLALALPDTNGTLPVRLMQPFVDLGTVTIHGFEGVSVVRPWRGRLAVESGVPAVLFTIDSNLVEYNLATGLSRNVLPPGAADQFCADPTVALDDPTLVLVSKRTSPGGLLCTGRYVWRWTTGMLVDSGLGTSQCVTMMRASVNTWIAAANKYYIFGYTRPSSSWVQQSFVTPAMGASPVWSSDFFAVSSDHAHAVPAAGYGDTLPIFNPLTLQVQSRVSGFTFWYNFPAAFDSSGKTLLVGALGHAGEPNYLLNVDVASGIIRDSMALEGYAVSVAVDEATDRAYVLDVKSPVPVLRVISLPSFTTQARIRTSSASLAGLHLGSDNLRFEPVLSPSEHRLYVAVSDQSCPGALPAQPGIVVRYSLRP